MTEMRMGLENKKNERGVGERIIFITGKRWSCLPFYHDGRMIQKEECKIQKEEVTGRV